MHGANFTHGYIYAALFAKTRLEGAIFESAKIDEVDFTDANLRQANFSNAEISDSNFDHAMLEGADLSEAQGVDVEHIVAAILSESTLLPEEIYTFAEIRKRMRNSPPPRWDA